MSRIEKPAILLALLLGVAQLCCQGADLPGVPEDLLAREIAISRVRVREFEAIRKIASLIGVHVWLFGGTAATYAHYVKWDLQRRSGDTRFQKERFDYDFTNIYRSTQDLDIVVDGSRQQIAVFTERLKAQFPYFLGSKEQWEVRSLREKIGDKEALLDNPDFLNQHTDSHSTGMIAITESPRPVVRDLRDWGAEVPNFLRDVATGKLHYYFSNGHVTTPRYLEGKNPPILSVIRYLTKLFQFGIEPREEDIGTIQPIIDAFDPGRDPGSYVRDWIERNAPKLVRHSTNVEYSISLLNRLGLRKKITSLSSPFGIGSAGWWLSREPLATSPVGQGTGKTIRELSAERGIPLAEFVVAHETRDFLAYESLTRDTTGTPNVLISRRDFPGEMAAFGNGHYTLIGKKGAVGSGLTVRYVPEPDAREGSDFLIHGDILVWKNRAALKVIPESLNMDAEGYFRMLREGVVLDHSDRGIQEKLERRIRQRIASLTPESLDAIARTVSDELEKHSDKGIDGNPPFFDAWFALPSSVKYPEIFLRSLSATPKPWRLFRNPHWSEPEFIDLGLERAKKDPESLDDFIRAVLLASPRLFDRYGQRWLERRIGRAKPYLQALGFYGFHGEKNNLELPYGVVKLLTEMSDDVHDDGQLIEFLSDEKWAKFPELIRPFIQRKRSASLSAHLFQTSAWQAQSWIVDELLAQDDWKVDTYITTYVMTRPFSVRHPEWMETLVKRGAIHHSFLQQAISAPHWQNSAELRELVQPDVGPHPYLAVTFETLSQAIKRGKTVRTFDSQCAPAISALGKRE